MKKTQTLGYQGEAAFYKACQKRKIPVIWRDRTSKYKIVVSGSKYYLNHFSGLKWDFELGYSKIEVKTSKSYCFSYSKNWPYFDYLVCIHKGILTKRFFIIPRWELPSPKIINANGSYQAEKWLTLWENRWDLLEKVPCKDINSL